MESLETFRYILLNDADQQMVQYFPDTDEIKEVTTIPNKNLYIWNEKHMLFYSYSESQLYLTDAGTLEVMRTIDFDDHMRIFDMDDKFIYTGKAQEDGAYLYSAISIETGEISELFVQDKEEATVGFLTSGSLMDVTVLNGYIYYPVYKDYNLCVARRNLSVMSQEEIFDEPYYDSRIREVGRKETYHNIIKDESTDAALMEITQDMLVVDERFAGAKEINRVLKEYQESFIEMADADLERVREDVQINPEMYAAYSYSSILSEISYLDDKYLSFQEDEYIYTGGAHGMPYWSAYTFDLQTGQELVLSDVISNSEEELKDIVVAAYEPDISAYPDAYREDALETVREYTDYNSQFFLTEEGIRFWFGPYDLACYAAGFQDVTIPYSEFLMKIQLKP